MRLILLAVSLIVLVAQIAWASAPMSVAELVQHIDRQLPAPAPADDAALLRRVTLDLAGRIPTVAEVREFLADRSPDKYGRAVDRLLASPGYARHWAAVWRHTLLPQADSDQYAHFAPPFEGWLRSELAANIRYDRLVRTVIAPDKAPNAGADAFQLAADCKPEHLAANTARLFLGLNLECAQCHDHPSARWSQLQFWEFAAFFGRPARDDRGLMRLALTIPGTARSTSPTVPFGRAPDWPSPLADDTGRQVLARWVTSSDNDLFSRNVVNRIWAGLFGTGLIEPLDDLSNPNHTSQSALLAELAGAFRGSGFDLKQLLRALTLTQHYRRARRDLRVLSGEQLYDSLRLAGGFPPDATDAEQPVTPSQRSRFIALFHTAHPSAATRSLQQALELMNGDVARIAANGPTLMTAATAPFLDMDGRLELVFLAVLGRPPTDRERADLVPRLSQANGEPLRRALADVLWALINSTEFSINH